VKFKLEKSNEVGYLFVCNEVLYFNFKKVRVDGCTFAVETVGFDMFDGLF